MKKVWIILSITVAAFITSFYELNGVYFVACVPLLIAFAAHKSGYFFYCFIGMAVAATFIDKMLLPILIAAFCATYLVMIILNKFKFSTKQYLSFLGALFGFLISFMQSYGDVERLISNIILATILSYFLCYNVIAIQSDLKFKENFSITKRQLIFIAFFFNFLVSKFSLPGIDFSVALILSCMANYLFVRLDPLSGVVGCFTYLILNMYSVNNLVIFSLIPLIFALKSLSRNNLIKGASFFLISLLISVLLKDYTLIAESIFLSVYVFLVPNRLISNINKYIIEYQDYELKLYQQSYYKCLRRNKKIQKVMGMLEQQMQVNPKMKKSTKELMFKNMQFLSDKLKEEDNIKVKENILNEMSYNEIEVLSLKIFSDYFSNYKIILEVKDNNLKVDKILEIFQTHLGIKFKQETVSCNKIINSYRFTFINNEKLSLNFDIKQRSKEESSCGDSYLSFSVKNKKYFLVSDGMGHGKNASKDSSAALLLLKDFIELGMEPSEAITSCNALIYNKEDEKFNTLDLLEYDIFDNKIYLYKNGSNVTYLKNKQEVKKVTSKNLPLGIVEKINIEKLEIDLDSEYIILTSDGFKKDLSQVIETSKSKNTKSLINDILQYEGDKIDDDQTIVVINVIKNY